MELISRASTLTRYTPDMSLINRISIQYRNIRYYRNSCFYFDHGYPAGMTELDGAIGNAVALKFAEYKDSDRSVTKAIAREKAITQYWSTGRY